MAITDAKKVDYLWKKLGYGATKTDTNAAKKAPNEAIASQLLLRGQHMEPSIKHSSNNTGIKLGCGHSLSNRYARRDNQ